MQYLGDTVVVQVGKEHLVVEAFLVLYKNVTTVPDTTMCIVEYCDLDNYYSSKKPERSESTLTVRFVTIFFL